MVSIKVQSELMEQELPQTALPSSNRFYVIYDELFRPMIFSNGSDGKLYLILADPNDGKNRLVDLSEKFRLAGKVTALNVTQDKDRKTYLVFAEEATPGGWSKVHVVKPFTPVNRFWIDESNLTGNVMKGVEKHDIAVSQIHLVSVDLQISWPTLADLRRAMAMTEKATHYLRWAFVQRTRPSQ